jgi:hypothetical protein
MERFGQQIYDSLTPSMVAAVERENQGNEVEVEEQEMSNKFNVPATSNKVTIPSDEIVDRGVVDFTKN